MVNDSKIQPSRLILDDIVVENSPNPVTGGGVQKALANLSTYHPNLLDSKWSDHILNDISWVRADTFSWQDGEVYSAAYNELLEDWNNENEYIQDSNGVWFKYGNTGRKLALPSEESNIINAYTTTGVAWYYILDQDNKRFKLPRVANPSLFEKYMSAPVVGNGTTIGVTDGTNNAGLGRGSSYFQPYKGAYGLATGSSYDAADYTKTNTTLGLTTDPTKSGMTADLSQATVYSVIGYLYFYVGGFSKEAIEQTAGINSETLNLKADKDLNNVNPSQGFKEMSIGWGLPDYSAGIDISSYITSRTNYTCPQIGFVTGHLDPNGTGFITVNANNVVRIVEHGYVSFYVKKGDLINVTFPSETTWGGTSLTFFPLKGVI